MRERRNPCVWQDLLCLPVGELTCNGGRENAANVKGVKSHQIPMKSIGLTPAREFFSVSLVF